MSIKKISFAVFIIIIILVVSQSGKKENGESKGESLQVASSTSSSSIQDLFTSGDFFSNAVWNDPSVVFVDGKFIMFASAGKGFSGDIDIYRLVSSDGVKWDLSPKEAVLTENADKEALDSKAVETPSVAYFKGEYHLFYTGYQGKFSDSKKYKIFHATSKDGITWQRGSSFLLGPTASDKLLPNYEFNQWVTAEPGVVVYKDTLYLYFSAIGADKEAGTVTSSIGVITSTDGKTWSSPRQVLKLDKEIYPASTYYGFSTPAAAVNKDGNIELYFDVVLRDPWSQIAIGKAVSPDGINGFVLDKKPLITRESAAFTKKEVISPSVLYKDGVRYLWFSGVADNKVTVGLLK